MRITALPLAGACLIDLERKRDNRGFFARVWCSREFRARGLEGRFVQSSISFTEKRGTIRGLHFQRPPFQEVKLVHCVRGAIFDVMVDVRTDAATFGTWHAETLRAEDHRLVYVAAGIAHGFQALVDGTEVHYWMSNYHHPDYETGLRFDDPAIAIEWPLKATHIAPRDLEWPKFKDVINAGVL